MANMKTDNSGIITTEFYTGRCPVRCEMCFVNFGQNGSSVPFTIYSKGNAEKVYAYANCASRGNFTLERLRKDKPRGELDWIASALCGGTEADIPGRNNLPRQWEPVLGFNKDTGKKQKFFSGMTKKDYRKILKPWEDDPGLYNIPKVPESPWFSKTELTRGFNGQYLPSVLRVNSMSDSSVAPTEWIAQILELWGDDCFFNTNIHAIKTFPNNMRAGLFHKVVVTANPGLQRVHNGPDRFCMYHPSVADIAANNEIVRIAREVYGMPNVSKAAVEEKIRGLTADEQYGLITLHMSAGTMKGDKTRPWHFYKPGKISDLHNGEFAKYEENIKFYRVRSLPTIQPDLSRFEGVPVVHTVLRFTTIAQALEFATKYNIETKVGIKSRQDEVVCNFYGVDYDVVPTGRESYIMMRDTSPANHSPNKRQWTRLTYSRRFFRAGKDQMRGLTYVCDRASQSCKACGLCATLDGTEENWANPRLAWLGITPKSGAKQDSYLSNSKGMPVPTPGVEKMTSPQVRSKGFVTVPKKINRTEEELAFFESTGSKYWSPEEAEKARKARERDKARRVERRAWKREKNPSVGEVGEPFQMLQGMMEEAAEIQRNPGGLEDLGTVMADSLKATVNYGAQGGGGADDFWVQGWNTHEEAATTVAMVYFFLMVLAKRDGMSKEEAIKFASDFSYSACGMDLFEDDLNILSAMYDNTSYWNDEFGPTG